MKDAELQEAIDAARKESNVAHYLGNYTLRDSYNAHLKELLEIQLQRIKDHDSKDQP
jgi:hypothetical protein